MDHSNIVSRPFDVTASDPTTPDSAAESRVDFLEALIDDELPFSIARERIVKEFERRYVARVLARNDGCVTKAARASGVAHRYFQLIRARLK